MMNEIWIAVGLAMFSSVTTASAPDDASVYVIKSVNINAPAAKT